VSEFRLGPVAYRVVKASAAVDPDVVAKEILAAIDPSDYEAALLQALRTIARIEIDGRRRASLNVGASASGQKPGKSWIQRARASWLEQGERNAAGAWAALGDFTRADLVAAAQFRRANAASSIAFAEWYESLDTLMAAHPRAKRVRDLPARVLSQVEQVAA